jgi:hypothetical protein
MAVIFFDGFSANRPRNEGYWGEPVTASENESGDNVYGSTTKKRNASAVNSGAQKLKAVGLPGKQQAVKCVFGTHTGKKLFFGFAISGLQIFPTGTDANGVAYPTTDARRNITLCRLYNSVDAEVLAISIGAIMSAGNVTELRFKINNESNEFVLPLSILEAVTATSVTFNTHTQTTFVVKNGAESDFIYVEFLVDLSDSASPNMELRINDESLKLAAAQGSAGEDEELTLSAAISNIRAIKLYGGLAIDTYIDDFYVLDDTTPGQVSFLGQETRVLSPDFDVPYTAEWNVVSALDPPSPTLNTVDADNYITTADFDKKNIFTPAAPLTANLIAAVMATSYARKTSRNAKYEHVYQRIGEITTVDGFVATGTALFPTVAGNFCLVPDTLHGSRPVYKNGPWYLFFDSFNTGYWFIEATLNWNSTFSSGSATWYNTSSALTPPTGTYFGWVGDEGGNLTLTAASVCPVKGPDGAVQTLGAPKAVTNLFYTCPENALCSVPHTTIAQSNPETNAAWTPQSVNSAGFGVRSLDPAL